MKHVSGDVYAAGSLAYVPQTAWIPNDSVRNNILFGKPYDEAKYQQVLAVCRLQRDLEVRYSACYDKRYLLAIFLVKIFSEWRDSLTQNR